MNNKKKLIVFVDDKPASHAAFRYAIGQDNTFSAYDITLAFDLADAVDLIKKHASRIAIMVIDLHLPGDNVPNELRKFFNYKRNEIKLNEGQLLGNYLRESHSRIPYLYLSAYEGKYRENWETETTSEGVPKCFDKDVSDIDFISYLKIILGI